VAPEAAAGSITQSGWKQSTCRKVRALQLYARACRWLFASSGNYYALLQHLAIACTFSCCCNCHVLFLAHVIKHQLYMATAYQTVGMQLRGADLLLCLLCLWVLNWPLQHSISALLCPSIANLQTCNARLKFALQGSFKGHRQILHQLLVWSKMLQHKPDVRFCPAQ